VRDYSGGMRRRIGIARALLGDPPIVIVDEPTTGLDLASRNRLRESLLSAAGERVILFSTHLASDVAAAAARVLVLDGGRLLYDGPARGLVEEARGSVFEAVVSDAELREFSHRYRVTTRVRTVDGIRVRAVVEDGQDPPGRIVEPNLEEAYLAVVGRQGGKRERSRHSGSLLDLERCAKRGGL
jgi:ABC-type multidrug transport system ATPase subunit